MGRHGFQKMVNMIKRELAQVLAEARDPRLSFLTLIDVKVSSDFRYADAYVSVMDEEDEEETIQLLKEHRGHFRSELAKRLRMMRQTPELRFEIDTVEKNAQRLDELFGEIEEEPPRLMDGINEEE